MIRKTTKEQLLSILQMMLKLHHTKEMENGKAQRKLLTQCQESAITIGTILEEKVEEAVKIVPLLEMYCEEVYVLAESAGTGEKIDFGGIYIGNGKLIYSPYPGEKVKFADINSAYWQNSFSVAISVA